MLEDKEQTMVAIVGAVGIKKDKRMLAGTTAEDSMKEEASEILKADRGEGFGQHHHRHTSQNLCCVLLECRVAWASYLTAICLSFLLCKMWVLVAWISWDYWENYMS